MDYSPKCHQFYNLKHFFNSKKNIHIVHYHSLLATKRIILQITAFLIDEIEET